MVKDPGHSLLHPVDEEDRHALTWLLRLRGEGHGLAEIVVCLRAETGFVLTQSELDRVLREVGGASAPRGRW